MGSATSSFVNPADLDGVGSQPTSKALARRAKQRRQILIMIGVSYVIDAGVLLLYAQAGATPLMIAPAYVASGLTLVIFSIILSEFGFNERFKDHYLVAPTATLCMLIALAFTYLAPEVGGMFLCTLFIVFSFSSLRSTPAQTMAIWTAMTICLAGLFLLTDKPVSMPHGSHLERFATLLVFVLTIGRCMFLGIFSSSLKQSLYQSGLNSRKPTSGSRNSPNSTS